MRANTQYTMAIHALLMIAGFPETKITSEAVAESTGSNPVLIRNLFAKLTKAGLIETKSGRGKTKLAKDASAITLWDIYAAVEDTELSACFPYHDNMSETCVVATRVERVVNPYLEEALLAMKGKLEAVTLADVIQSLHEDIRNAL